MTEDEAKARIASGVPRETLAMLDRFVALVIEEAGRQNLISASTIETIWSRHVLDSVQLLDHVPAEGRWIDLGSGAGFPGMVIGIIGRHQVTLAESRAKRIGFLQNAITHLGLQDRVTVQPGRVEAIRPQAFGIISARAFAPMDRLLDTAIHLSDRRTHWVLPKGRSANAELDGAIGSWQGDFWIKASITDPEAAIIVATDVRRKQAISGRRSKR